MRCFIILGLAAFTAIAPANAKPKILAELSEKQVDIGTRFAGANLLLFGTVRGVPRTQTPDVVVILRGPDQAISVRHKSNVAGIWMNTRSVRFQTAPGYFALASTRPLDVVADRTWRAVYELGIDWLHLSPAEGSQSASEKITEFRDGFIGLREKLGLFSEREGAVKLIDNSLFLTRIDLPARVPVGQYRAEVYLFIGGKYADKTELKLNVEKSGVERSLFDFAHNQPLLYGLFSVLLALIAGWTASVFIRR
jgi:uncharacterized protein (TIGR02186 family)